MQVSIIIPVLNEGPQLHECLAQLQFLRGKGNEIILVDGGSNDNCLENIDQLVDKFIVSSPGRAVQMNLGAKHAGHDMDILLFLHADTKLSKLQVDILMQQLNEGQRVWGRFDVRLSGRHWSFRLIEFSMNLRSRISAIATGDQAIFVYKKVFETIGGFAPIELMEDIELSSRLNKISRPICLRPAVTTSSRKWEQQGIIKTITTMWLLRFAYYIGISPKRLHSIYYSLSGS